MPIDSVCKTCGKQLRVDDAFAGKMGRCPVCQSVYDIPLVSQVFSTPVIASDGANPFADPPTNATATTAVFAETTYHSPNSGRQATSVQIYVRTPDGNMYGPADSKTIHEWIEQGRLDDTCFIRTSESEEWLPLATWTRSVLEAPRTSATLPQPASPVAPTSNAAGYVFGSAPIAANQTPVLPNSGSAVASLVLGIAGWLVCITGIGGIVCSILAIVLGKIELTKMKNGQVNPKDRWMALTGMWLGIVELVLAVLAIVGICIAIVMDQ